MCYQLISYESLFYGGMVFYQQVLRGTQLEGTAGNPNTFCIICCLYMQNTTIFGSYLANSWITDPGKIYYLSFCSAESNGGSHLCVVLLQVDQLLLQALHLHLQVRSGRGQVIQELAQSGNVGLHWHAYCHLVLKPVKKKSMKVTVAAPTQMMLPPPTKKRQGEAPLNQFHQFCHLTVTPLWQYVCLHWRDWTSTWHHDVMLPITSVKFLNNSCFKLSTHLILKSSAASLALSICNISLALSCVAILIWRRRKHCQRVLIHIWHYHKGALVIYYPECEPAGF